MTPDVIGILSVGIATGALFVTGLHAVRNVLRGKARHAQEPRGDSASHAEQGQADGRAAEPPSHRPADNTDRGDEERTPGDGYDPRPHEDKARRRLAFLLLALLAVMVLGLMAMVAFGIITVAEVKEFDVIVAVLVPLVTVTVAYYFKSGGNGKGQQ
jgi:hypothetical protein